MVRQQEGEAELFPAGRRKCRLAVTLDYDQGQIGLDWSDVRSGEQVAEARIRWNGPDDLTWLLTESGCTAPSRTAQDRLSIRHRLERFRQRFAVNNRQIQARIVRRRTPGMGGAPEVQPLAIPFGLTPWGWLEEEILEMAEQFSAASKPLGNPLADPAAFDFDRVIRREARRTEKAEREAFERAQRIAEAQRRQAEEQRRKELARRQRDIALAAKEAVAVLVKPLVEPRQPVPPVPIRVDLPELQLQETMLPLADLRSYFLKERAGLWWISNQSDDLLGLPYCNIERLDYQIRTALRVIGPLRGRALLSDEVGLGKTIEAGLVIKEYLTRGMIKRFLVLTVPSLVDQWEEELLDKFGLETATTHHPAFRSDPGGFWQNHLGIVASLHTLKQPAHLANAQGLNWDMLVIDEAHYLRNRTSQAWQAVNALPRQFLLLLTATPVQNSLEDLYNLVTLLQPGQLPSPKEFRERYIDKKQPHKPREPEELRRLLGQVMIRNTRSNAGIKLPPRRAETVLFQPENTERDFWECWEKALRERLGTLGASQASLWGRLLLQTGGSSPAAWQAALESFPSAEFVKSWSQEAPLHVSWRKKCDLLIPLTTGEGGVVIFTQYLATQLALAEYLREVKVPTWVINGQTPSETRQPITEEFRGQGGALLLTHSGTEGRNLQFCHRLVNFDLPWNPMEIEQRIGRLHRIGQQHPVRIYNLVQAGTLQEHLLTILQEKLNLFELVVGETGLILGDRFSSDEFAEEVLRRWRDSDGRVAESFQTLGEELAAAPAEDNQVKQLDETLFAKDYESL